MTAIAGRRPVVAILGGGFSGAATAFHLARTTDAVLPVVVEPRPVLGAGLAYSTTEPAHRINVPAAKMSLIADEPDHFADWLAAGGALDGDPEATTPAGDAFPQRALFGAYVADHLGPLLAAGRVTHLRAVASAVHRSPRDFEVELHTGQGLGADAVVIATTHPLPGTPPALQEIAGRPGFIGDPYAPDALAAVGHDDRVLIVGTGLTAGDIVATLERRGHRGTILLLSRRGLRSRGHAPAPTPAFGDFSSAPATTVRALLARIRVALREAGGDGLTWHPVLDAVRAQGGAIWTALTPRERSRLVRHLRAHWDVHRFRVAPQVEAAIARAEAEGRLRSVAARPAGASHDHNGFEVRYRPRGGPVATGHFDRVMLATGPAHGALTRTSPLLAQMAAAGLIAADPYDLGLATAGDGTAIGRDGAPVRDLHVGGPLARGTFGELMGLPEVARYAEWLAGGLADRHGARPAATVG